MMAFFFFFFFPSLVFNMWNALAPVFFFWYITIAAMEQTWKVLIYTIPNYIFSCIWKDNLLCCCLRSIQKCRLFETSLGFFRKEKKTIKISVWKQKLNKLASQAKIVEQNLCSIYCFSKYSFRSLWFVTGVFAGSHPPHWHVGALPSLLVQPGLYR